MEAVPILRVGDVLMVSIQVDLHDQLAERLAGDVADAVAKHDPKGVLIDISGVEVVDTFIGRVLGHIAQLARLMGSRVVLVGMRPAVAITLVELGMDLPGIETALNVDRGFRALGLEPPG
ncbi:MAG: anti-anti-sigma factor [Sandaracinus sp.]|nr:anti-anti-sigma factor [Myxococcales bacterium]MAT28731.1 anti-anti-sigma factor [Sandaracinus sp.]HJK89297.1 STAS domain-containing protein [Polyangiaceae bacterium LLY-WYZ-15_(1-7)]MBJ69830.1 anti-anti-sigma factor [Sandaracinus sp.]HJL25257.1 STAS domain-containing protein [Polyangiaceae bacterium LLY-WYZ-15_(1-7)]